MPGKYARLRSDWLLRGWTDFPWAVINWTNGDLRELTKKAFYVAESCDGRADFESLAFLPDHQALLDKFIAEGIAEGCQEGEGFELCQSYRRAENPRLTGLHWSVTGLCNLNCRHCYMEAPSGRYGELQLEDMLRLVEELERANVLEVSLTGGEPFLRKDLLEIMTALARKKIRISEIYSNGLLITEERLESIKRIGLNPSFQISFDGKGGHEYMRGREGIEVGVIAAIRKVRAAGFCVVVASSVDRVNIGRLGETYDLLRGLDVQFWRIGVPQQMGNWRGTTTAVSYDEEADAYAPVLGRWVRDGKPFAIQLGEFLRAAGKGGPKAAPKPPLTPESYDCAACRVKPYLLPDGALLPCPGYVDSALQERMPNVLKEGLSNAWTKSFLRTIADLKKSDLLPQNEECSRCEHFGDCGAGCRASALTETGDLMAKDPAACDLWKKGYRRRFRELADGVSGPTAK